MSDRRLNRPAHPAETVEVRPFGNSPERYYLDPLTARSVNNELGGLKAATKNMTGRLVEHGDPGAPPQAAGLPGLREYMMPALEGTQTRGFMVDPRPGESAHRMSQAYFLSPADPHKHETRTHEAEHLLARQGLGQAGQINTKFDELMGLDRNFGRARRRQFARDAVDAAAYLKDKYGLEDTAYFQPEYLAFQEKHGASSALFSEQVATLAAIEQMQGVDLTRDPVLRKTLFKDKAVRETYNALTGLRQTRLDARDLPPYTRQPEDAPRLKDSEPKKGMWERVKDGVGRLI